MSEKSLPALGGKTFEDLKLTNTHDAEYWSARDLQPLLGYSQWRRFEPAIERAKTSCKESGNSPEHHFAGTGKPITGGKGAVQLVDDYHLSRFACSKRCPVRLRMPACKTRCSAYFTTPDTRVFTVAVPVYGIPIR